MTLKDSVCTDKIDTTCSDISGLGVGLDMLLKMEGKGKQDKGLVLVTNGKSNEADQPPELLQGIRQQIISQGFHLTV